MGYTDLVVKGKMNFMGIEIPVVSGGFGEDKMCVSDKTIAEIHGTTTSEIRKAINRNVKRFKDGIDYIDLKIVRNLVTDNLLEQLGYSKMQIGKAEHIYIVSERGYAKLIKIMDDDASWDVHDKLVDDYFNMREKLQQLTPFQQQVLVLLDSKTSAIEKAGAAKEIEVIGRGEICDRAIITLDKVEDMVLNALQGQECLQYMYMTQIRNVFKEVLEYTGNVYFKKFPTKDYKRLERVPTMMPTEKFQRDFVERGLAKVRPITKNGDTRGKEEISFTIYVQEWIESEEFISTFVKLASRYIPQDEDETEE